MMSVLITSSVDRCPLWLVLPFLVPLRSRLSSLLPMLPRRSPRLLRLLEKALLTTCRSNGDHSNTVRAYE